MTTLTPEDRARLRELCEAIFTAKDAYSKYDTCEAFAKQVDAPDVITDLLDALDEAEALLLAIKEALESRNADAGAWNYVADNIRDCLYPYLRSHGLIDEEGNPKK